MTAWVKFINKTSHKIIYLRLDGRFVPFPLVKGTASKYILISAGSVCTDIFDSKLRFSESYCISVAPSKKQSIVLY